MSSTSTRRQKVEEKERAIMRAARDVFIEKGESGARIAEIGRRAGIAEGTVYLYFKTKTDLLRALVEEFWTDLTERAQAVTGSEGDTLTALRVLAGFHLDELIAQNDFIALTLAVQRKGDKGISSRDFMRDYVSVFDTILERAKSRGDMTYSVPVWVLRDMFYGTLEHAARTSVLHGRKAAPEVVENLMCVFERNFTSGSPKVETVSENILSRLEDVVDRLEGL